MKKKGHQIKQGVTMANNNKTKSRSRFQMVVTDLFWQENQEAP